MLTLQLNITYEPVKLLTWQEAMVQWFTGKVEVVAEYDSPCRSMNTEMRKPAVVRLTKRYHRHNYEIPLNRKNCFARDGWMCQYCGRKLEPRFLTLDHVIPRSRKGKTTWKNVVTACFSCNQAKGARTPEEAGMPLLNRPVKPKWMPWLLARAVRCEKVPREWSSWLGWVATEAGNLSPP